MSFSSLSNITVKEARDVLSRVNDMSDVSDFTEGQTRIVAEDLSFYPGTKHCSVEDDSSTPIKQVSCLYRLADGIFSIVEHHQQWVMDRNVDFGLVLDVENVADYVAFLMAHTPLKAGKMAVLQSIEDMPWRDEPILEVRKGLSSLLTPFLVEEKSGGKGWHCAFSALYAESIFTIHADLDNQGRITLLSEEEVASDLPVFSKAYAV